MLGFDAEVFRGRRTRVADALGRGAMVLPPAPVQYRSGDTEYRYRPDSDLFYLTGFTEPGALAVINPSAREGPFTLFVRPRDKRTERWWGARVGPDDARELYGPDRLFSMEELEDRLPGLLRGVDRLYYRLGGDARSQALILEVVERSRTRGARRGLGPRTITDPGEILNEMRLIKESCEIERLREAARLTVDGFRTTLSEARPGMGEWDVEGLLEGRFRARGVTSRDPAFATIVGSGENACTLHYVGNGRRIEEGDLVLLDGGAQVDLYNADITRTFPVSGAFSPDQRDAYEVVLSAHAAALREVRPGRTTEDIHRAALEALVKGMIALGLAAGSVEEIIEKRRYEAFYPHQTSHWLGLEVHDVGDYAREGASRKLRPGMVLTVEPGLYLPPGSLTASGYPLPPSLAGIGVRIEDDLLVTAEGHENLSAGLPVTVEGIERLAGAGV